MLDIPLDFLSVRQAPAGQVLRLEQPPGPAARASRSGKLQAPSETVVTLNGWVKGGVFGRAGLVGGDGQLHQLLQFASGSPGLYHLLKRVAGGVLQGDAKTPLDERLELLALRGPLNNTLRQLPEPDTDALFLNQRGAGASAREFAVNVKPAFIDPLVAMPFSHCGGIPVPGWHPAHALAHGDNVVGCVCLEALPLAWMRVAGCQAHLAVCGLGPREQLHQFLAFGQFAHVVRHLEHGAKGSQAGG